MKRYLLPLTLLLVTIGLFLEFWDSPPTKFTKNNTAVTSTPKASAYMNNTVTKQFSKQGNLETLLISERTDLFQRQGTYIFASPEIIFYTPNEPSWQLSAKKGVLTSKKEDRIVLTDNVYIWQKLVKGGLQELNTSKMIFYPEKKFAETNKQVKLTTPSQIMTGVGMHADLATQKYKFLSNVQGTLNAH
jgi:lipopolysaccharide export system protein LptC